MFNFLLKYNKKYIKEQNVFEYVKLNSSKIMVDRLLDEKGKWLYTQYLPIGRNSDVFDCYIWSLEYHYISCLFKNGTLIDKKLKREGKKL